MAQKVSLHNTLSNKLEEITPIAKEQIGLYCCGPTVYNYQHIGNFKTFIFEDILARTLRLAGHKVKHVMNITDVGHLTGDGDEGQDKMVVAMLREGKTSVEISEHYTNKFFEDWDQLNLTRPDITCKATDHIDDMIALIQKIQKNGYAYLSNGNVYFDVEKLPDYGKLAKLDLKKLKAGATQAVDTNKKSPFDFVLWFTKSKFDNQELQWDSPWGRGYPGWHIECSAMSMKYLGDTFDIHCGGIDHVPVHHTNEIAQSEAATGKPWVNVWMHSEFILLNNEKMSKSKGGFLILDDLIAEGFSPTDYRMLVLSAHYRSQLNFSLNALEQSKRNVEKLKKVVLSLKTSITVDASQLELEKELMNRFSSSLFRDLNTPQALAVMWELLNSKSINPEKKLGTLLKMDDVLGLGVNNWEEELVEIPKEATKLLEARKVARQEKNWSEADTIREKLSQMGFEVVDSDSGAVLKKV